MTYVKHRYNPETGKFEVDGVLSDSLGLFGPPIINVSGRPLYDRKDLDDMGYDSQGNKMKPYENRDKTPRYRR